MQKQTIPHQISVHVYAFYFIYKDRARAYAKAEK